MLILIKMALFQIIFFFVLYRAGSLISHYTRDNSLVGKLLSGFILLLVYVQIISTPLIYFQGSFQIVYILLIISIILTVILSFIFPAKVGLKEIICNYKKNARSILIDKFYFVLLLIAVCLIIFQAIASTYLASPHSDDTFYVSLVTTSIDNHQLYFIEPSTGLEGSRMSSLYKYGTWEILQACFAKAFNVYPTDLAHTFLPFSLIILAYCAYLKLASELVSKKYIPLFLIALSLFHIFGGFTGAGRSQGLCLLATSWHGKSVFLSIIIPLAYFILIRYLRTTRYNRYLPFIIALSLAAISLTLSALYLTPPLLYGTLFLDAIIRKRWKAFFISLPGLLPFLIYALLMKFDMGQTANYDPSFIEGFSSFGQFLLVMGSGWYAALYVLCIPLFLKQKNYFIKLLFVFTPLFFVATIWNPLLAPYIGKYLSSYATYWRFFWLIPTGIALAYAAVMIVKFFAGKKIELFILLSCLILLSFSGKFIYTTPQNITGFRFPENSSKINQEVLDTTEFLQKYSSSQEKILLAPSLFSYAVRQITADIKVVWTQGSYVKAAFRHREDGEAVYNRLFRLFDQYSYVNISINSDDFKRIFSNAPLLSPIAVSVYDRLNSLSVQKTDPMTSTELESVLSDFSVNFIIVSLGNKQLVEKITDIGYQEIFRTKNYFLAEKQN